MCIKEKLKAFVHYFIVTRQVGHTQTLIDGIVNTPLDPIVITYDYKNATNLRRRTGQYQLNAFGLNQLDLLQGNNKPLVFDNAALLRIFEETLYTIEDKEFLLSDYESQIKGLRSEVAQLKTKLNSVEIANITFDSLVLQLESTIKAQALTLELLKKNKEKHNENLTKA